MVKTKSLLASIIVATTLTACGGNTLNSKLQDGHKLKVIEISYNSTYEQFENGCYVSNGITTTTFQNSRIFYTVNGREMTVSVKGDVNYTFYHYAVESWGII